MPRTVEPVLRVEIKLTVKLLHIWKRKPKNSLKKTTNK